VVSINELMKVTQHKINNAPYYFSQIILGDLYDRGIDCWIAGGSVRDYFMDVNAVDYDIFFPNKKEFNKAKEFFESKNATKEWESENGVKYSYQGRIFDLVKIYHPSPESTISYFDFTTAMFAVDDKNVFVGDTSLKDLEERILVINKVTFPDSTLNRAFKYYQKGFKMSAEESQKLAKIIKEMPLKSGNDDFLNFTAKEEEKKESNHLPYILGGLGLGLLFVLFKKK